MLTKEKIMIRLLVDSASDYTQEEIKNKNLYIISKQSDSFERYSLCIP